MASASARSAAPTVSAARPMAMSSCTRCHSAGLVARRAERDDRRVVEDQAGQLAGRVERGDELDRGAGGQAGRPNSSRYERTPSSLRATTMTQSAVCPSITKGFSPVSTHCAALRRARVRTVASGSPWPCSPRAMVPRRVPAARSARSSVAPRARAASVAATAEEKNGPGNGRRPICSSTMHVSSRPAPVPPCSAGDQEAGPAEVDQRRPQRGRDARRRRRPAGAAAAGCTRARARRAPPLGAPAARRRR